MVLEFYIDSVIFSSVRLAFCIRKKEHLEKTFFKNFEISRNLLLTGHYCVILQQCVY